MDLPKKVVDRARAAMSAAAARVFRENHIEAALKNAHMTWDTNNDLGLDYTFHLEEVKKEPDSGST